MIPEDSIRATETAVAKRQTSAGRLLSPVTGREGIPIYLKPTPHGVFLGAGEANSLPFDASEIMVTTKRWNIVVNFFELWKQSSNAGELWLCRSYVHLRRVDEDSVDEEELLALHFDAEIAEEDESYIYKRGPHIHVRGGKHPFAHSHVALALQVLEITCADLNSFDTAYYEFLRMIEIEFLRRLDS